MFNNKKLCEDCVHFIQHYIKEKEYFRPIGCGHCENKKPKEKADKICELFKEKQSLLNK